MRGGRETVGTERKGESGREGGRDQEGETGERARGKSGRGSERRE